MSGFTRRQLGKTGLHVSPLGIGGGSCIQSDDLLYAFERGINYFFFSSDLHHLQYSRSAPALRQLCKRGSAFRDQVVLATVSYVNDPEKLHGVIIDQFLELGVDYIDVFHWGWITENDDVHTLLDAASQLKDGESDLSRFCRGYIGSADMVEHAEQVNRELVQSGLVRFVGMSFHSRRAALVAMQKDIDVMMLRYNPASPGVEKILFSKLSGDKCSDPGIVVFNTAHTGTALFTSPPAHYPSTLPIPSIPDCYRFALSNPWVDVVLTGVMDRVQIDQALEAVDLGPLDADEYAFLREYGSIFERVW